MYACLSRWCAIPLRTHCTTLVRADKGVTAIEYGLIAAMIAVVIIASLSMVGAEVHATFDTWSGAVHNAVEGSQGNGQP